MSIELLVEAEYDVYLDVDHKVDYDIEGEWTESSREWARKFMARNLGERD